MTPAVAIERMTAANPSDSVVRIGLLGCGRIARMFHLPILQRLPGCELVAVADNEAARLAEARKAAPKAAAFDDFADVVDDPNVDAVVVTLPTALHADAALRALERGKHVYVEKPLAASTAEGLPVLEAWRRSGLVGAVGYVFRFHPLFRALKDALASNAIGEIVAVRTSFGSAARDLPDWKQSRTTGGGAILDLASHHVDLVRFLFEREVEHAGAALRTVRTAEDTAVVHLTLEGGLPVETFASSSAVQEDVIEVYGTEAKLVADRFQSRSLLWIERVRKRGAVRRTRAALRDALRLGNVLVPPREPSFAAALESFATAARGSRFEGASFDDGYRALLVVETAERSARSGRILAVG